jgi:uncharacterized membrane protein
MATKHPAHPILIALPVVAFAVVIAALVGHSRTGDPMWYRTALFADLAGLVIAVFATLAGVIDAATVPRFTVARVAGLRQAGFDVVAMPFFAVTATLIFNRYEGRGVGDIAPLALAIVGLVATGIAGWYGHVLVRDFQRHETTVWYPAHMLDRIPARRPPGSSPTVV